MRQLRAWFLRLAGLFSKERRDSEFAAELESHLAMHIEDNLRSGMTPAEARRRALLALGGVDQTMESYRDRRSVPLLEHLLQDLRFGARMLRKSPAFTAVAILTLSLGIGANTAIFTVVNSVLLRPLAFRDPGRLVALREINPKAGVQGWRVSPANFLDWRDSSDDFEDVAAMYFWDFDYTGKGEPESITAEAVSRNFFAVMGIPAQMGRTFLPEEYEPGKNHVIMLSDGLWRRHFGADPQILGRTLSLSDESFTVVGILPANLSLPWLGRQREIYVPMAFTPEVRQLRSERYLQVVGRLKPGHTLAQARTRLAGLAARLARQFPVEDGDMTILALPLDDQIVGRIRPMLLVLLAAVGVVLLIVCANVGNLLLARGSRRQRELAIRASLGADRRRLLLQLLTESLLLGLLGSIGGLLLARWLTVAVVRLNTIEFPRLAETSMDWRVLLFGVGLGVSTALVFGLAPALHVCRADLQAILRESGDRTAVSAVRHGLRSFFVISQVALALVLLASAGLVLRSFVNLLRVNPGYASDRVLALQVFAWKRYTKPAQRAALFHDALEKVAAVPGVEAAGAVSTLPYLLGGPQQNYRFAIEGQPPLRPDQQPTALATMATPGYFRAMEIPLLRGRLFTDFDRADSPPVVLINETMAQRYWPDIDPIGRRIDVSPLSDNGAPFPCEIVGIVGDIRQYGAERQPEPEFFRPHAQDPSGSMAFVVRTSTDPVPMTRTIQGAIWQADPRLTFYYVETMQNLEEASRSSRRLSLVLLAAFAGFALLLAAMGIYGVISYSTAQRTQEIGVRIALGAQPQQVARLVLAEGMRLVLFGIAAGVAAALAMARLLGTLLFGVSSADPWTFAAVTALLASVAFLACYFPARRAVHLDPVVALRHE